MKTHIFIILVFGLSAYAKTIAEVIAETENGAQTTDSFNDPQTTENSFVTSEPEIDLNLKNVDASMEIVIEENVKTPYNLLNEAVTDFDLGEVSPNDGDFYYNDVINRDPNEIMDTAAGFAPLPFLKKRRKAQRPYATRRFFQKPYAYRRFQYFYPYYYGFYRPSSLRYYNYY
ncbi:unnamed protein product [Pieris macdunnoughi]|uniref:Uncharacterized protein n=1 Tax=Pieris macdunnoughi TaxID=345717 RepID=A0A821U3A4_9NEOP|nr:unnamed protein product [Pieris macdunnoughi]